MSNSSSDRADERSGTGALSESEYHRILATPRRRILLDVLEDRSTPVGVDELASALEKRSGGDVERIAISLHHDHLPKLVGAGVVEYDLETTTVTSFERLDR